MSIYSNNGIGANKVLTTNYSCFLNMTFKKFPYNLVRENYKPDNKAIFFHNTIHLRNVYIASRHDVHMTWRAYVYM